MATPLVKSPAWLSTLAGVSRPETVPVSGELAVMVTLLADALKVVIVLFETSWAVSVFVPVKATPSVWLAAKASAKWSRAPALITTLPEVPVLVPDVALKVPVVALPV